MLQLTADLPAPGVYETWIDTATASGDATQPDRRIHVVVTREAASVPLDFLQDPRPVPIVGWPWNHKRRTVILQLANTTTKPVEFLQPVLLDFGAKLSGTEPGTADTMAAATALPTLDASGCITPLAPGTRCPLHLTLGRDLWPGQYTVGLGVGGPGGGWSQKTASVFVRLPLTAAILVAALGASAGWLVQEWRARGRLAFDGLIDLGLLRRRVEAIVAGALGQSLEATTRPILDTIDMLEARARSGLDAKADITALSDRVGCLSVLASVERAWTALPTEARVMLAASHGRFVLQGNCTVAGSTPSSTPDGFGATATSIAQAINDWPALATARADAAARLALFARLLTLPANDPARSGAPPGDPPAAVLAARAALQAAVTATVTPLLSDAAPTAVADRVGPLQAAVEQASADLDGAIEANAAALDRTFAVRTDLPVLPDADRAAATAARGVLSRRARTGDPAGRIAMLGPLWHIADPPRPGGLEDNLRLAPTDLGAPIPVGPDLPVASAFGLIPGRSTVSLMRQRNQLEWATNLIVLGAISLTAAALVGTSPAWGTPQDLIGLLLTAFGSRVVITALANATQPAAAAHP